MNLDRRQPRSGRVFAGRVVLAALICMGGLGALTAHARTEVAPGAQMVEVNLQIDVGGKQSTQRKYARLNERFNVAVEEAGSTWGGEMVVKPTKDGSVEVQSTIEGGASGSGAGVHTMVNALNQPYRLIRHDPKTKARLDLLVRVTKAPVYDIALQLDVGNQHLEPKVQVQAGEAFAVSVDEAGAQWRIDGVLRPLSEQQLDLTTTVTRANKIIAKPRLVFKLNDEAGIGVGNKDPQQAFKMKLKVSQVSSSAALLANGAAIPSHERP